MPEQLDLQPLFDAITHDYWRFSASTLRLVGGEADTVVHKERVAKFRDGLSASVGKKYIRIMKDGSAWGFVVATDDDKKFKRGDILKAAGWSTPARNRARGNVLDGDFSWVKWTGPEYLR